MYKMKTISANGVTNKKYNVRILVNQNESGNVDGIPLKYNFFYSVFFVLKISSFQNQPSFFSKKILSKN